MELHLPDDATAIVVNGVRFSREVFEFLSDAAEVGAVFRLLKNNDCVTLERLDQGAHA